MCVPMLHTFVHVCSCILPPILVILVQMIGNSPHTRQIPLLFKFSIIQRITIFWSCGYLVGVLPPLNCKFLEGRSQVHFTQPSTLSTHSVELQASEWWGKSNKPWCYISCILNSAFRPPWGLPIPLASYLVDILALSLFRFSLLFLRWTRNKAEETPVCSTLLRLRTGQWASLRHPFWSLKTNWVAQL